MLLSGTMRDTHGPSRSSRARTLIYSMALGRRRRWWRVALPPELRATTFLMNRERREATFTPSMWTSLHHAILMTSLIISHDVFLWTLSRVINSFITRDKALRGTPCNSALCVKRTDPHGPHAREHYYI